MSLILLVRLVSFFVFGMKFLYELGLQKKSGKLGRSGDYPNLIRLGN